MFFLACQWPMLALCLLFSKYYLIAVSKPFFTVSACTVAVTEFIDFT